MSSISKKILINFETQKTLIIENEIIVDAYKGNPYKRRELNYAFHHKARLIAEYPQTRDDRQEWKDSYKER